MTQPQTVATPEPARPTDPLSRPIRSLCWLSMFTEAATLILLPIALVAGAIEMITGGPESTYVRMWLAYIIAILPFHIVVVDRLLRRPRRHAPPTMRASHVFAGIFVAAMLGVTCGVVVLPALETFDQLALGKPVGAAQLMGYLGIMISYQIVLWMAWLASPQLDVPAGTQNLVWRPSLRLRRKRATASE